MVPRTATIAEITRRNVGLTWQGFRNAASMRVGQELKAARKNAGISVEVISKRTKIKVNKLVALEKGDFKNLPTGLYLFSTVRAYAREVRIDPEPIVERLRAEFAEKDALDALHALDATGTLNAKSSAKTGRSPEGRSNLFRSTAIAASVIVIAGAGAGAGAYLYRMNHAPREIQSNAATPSLPAPTPPLRIQSETTVVPPAPPAPATPVAATVDPPEQPATTRVRTRPAKIQPGSSARKTIRETVATIGAMADTLGSSGVMPQTESLAPARSDRPSERTGTIEDLRLDAPALAAAP
jgi:cytoskeleton protein RodZ